MWLLNAIDESKMTPRSRTWLTGLMWESPTVIKGIEIFESCCGEPINMNSVLLSLIFRKLTFIHCWISRAQASMRLMQDWACCCEGLKDTYMISWRGNVENNCGPRTEPWGTEKSSWTGSEAASPTRTYRAYIPGRIEIWRRGMIDLSA